MKLNLYTKKDAAKKLNVTDNFIGHLIDDGHLETIQIGRRKLVTQAAIDKFLAALA
jgi:excisionase family DNA binding protein